MNPSHRHICSIEICPINSWAMYLLFNSENVQLSLFQSKISLTDFVQCSVYNHSIIVLFNMNLGNSFFVQLFCSKSLMAFVQLAWQDSHLTFPPPSCPPAERGEQFIQCHTFVAPIRIHQVFGRARSSYLGIIPLPSWRFRHSNRDLLRCWQSCYARDEQNECNSMSPRAPYLK